MINHKYKIIFIHIPKCAGTSITKFFSSEKKINWKQANYNELYGWCPKRKLFMQHATAKQLLETNLITEEQWKTYYKFTFVRNPWDRALSDYFWLINVCKINGSFKDYIMKRGQFYKVLNNQEEIYYRGDHHRKQTEFFDFQGSFKLDYVGRFENFASDINEILKAVGVENKFNIYTNKSHKAREHYSIYYTRSLKQLVESKFKEDIEILRYSFEEKKQGLYRLKNFL
jgi:hypothetical protein